MPGWRRKHEQQKYQSSTLESGTADSHPGDVALVDKQIFWEWMIFDSKLPTIVPHVPGTVGLLGFLRRGCLIFAPPRRPSPRQ